MGQAHGARQRLRKAALGRAGSERPCSGRLAVFTLSQRWLSRCSLAAESSSIAPVKITLDLGRLLEEGQITPEEYARFESLAAQETASLALNIVVAFGVVAVAGGTLALLQSAEASILLGSALGAVGVYLSHAQARRWRPLAGVLLLTGSLTAAGGVVALTGGSAGGFALLAAAFAGSALLANSGLLSALSALSLLAASGGATDYEHAAYFLGIEQPLVTVVLFGLLSFATHRASMVIPADYGRVATIFSRTSLFVVNLGFWIGSLWGDSLGQSRGGRPGVLISEEVFAVAWAVGLVAAGVWAAGQNHRWVVNLVAVFAAIHFYTQYFERLGASPGSILAAGLVALAIAVGLTQYNRTTAPGPAGTA